MSNDKNYGNHLVNRTCSLCGYTAPYCGCDVSQGTNNVYEYESQALYYVYSPNEAGSKENCERESTQYVPKQPRVEGSL